MQQVPLSIPVHNLSYNNFIFSANSEDKALSEASPNTSYPDITNSAETFFMRHFNWEYFSNELEFE